MVGFVVWDFVGGGVGVGSWVGGRIGSLFMVKGFKFVCCSRIFFLSGELFGILIYKWLGKGGIGVVRDRIEGILEGEEFFFTFEVVEVGVYVFGREWRLDLFGDFVGYIDKKIVFFRGFGESFNFFFIWG